MWHYSIFRTTIQYTKEQLKLFELDETDKYSYSIREYYPLDKNDVKAGHTKGGWTIDDIAPHGTNKEELIRELAMMLQDALTMGVRDSETGEIVEE